MKTNAAEFAGIIGRSKAWVTLQISEGMPAEGSGRPGAEMEIDTGAAIAWLLERAKARVELKQRRRAPGAGLDAQKLGRKIFGLMTDQSARLKALRDLLEEQLTAWEIPAETQQRMITELRAAQVQFRLAANAVLDELTIAD